MPAVRALSSSSREAAEDNVEEREKFWVGRNYRLQITDGQTEVEFEIVFEIKIDHFSKYHKKLFSFLGQGFIG